MKVNVPIKICCGFVIWGMTSSSDRLNWLCLFVSMSKALVSEHYLANIDLDNKLSIHPPAANRNSKSTLRCACICVTCNGCNCFSLNSQAELGRLYFSCDPSDGTVDEDGWRFYSNTSLEPVISLSFLVPIIFVTYSL